jgi:hypothetical protein
LVELGKIVTSSNNYLVKFLKKSQVVIHIKEKKNQCFRKFSIEKKRRRKKKKQIILRERWAHVSQIS